MSMTRREREEDAMMGRLMASNKADDLVELVMRQTYKALSTRVARNRGKLFSTSPYETFAETWWERETSKTVRHESVLEVLLKEDFVIYGNKPRHSNAGDDVLQATLELTKEAGFDSFQEYVEDQIGKEAEIIYGRTAPTGLIDLALAKILVRMPEMQLR